VKQQESEPRSEKYLWLIRHAKSARPFGVEDMQRPLNPRGQRDGGIMAKQLAKFENPPQSFLVSDALRTRQTAELINEILQVEIELVPELYSANSTDVEYLIREMQEEVERVAIVTHLPTIERCIWACKTRNMIEFFPTLAMVCLEHIGPWKEFNLRSAIVRKFVVPRTFRQ
jgi:phosphohistidine phosphatase